MRRLFGFLCLILLAALPLHAEKVKTLPAPTGYVNDLASVLSGPARSQMETVCTEVHDKTKAQIFIVTIHTLEGESVDQFANELFARWKIGEKKTDRGVLMLFAIDDHKWRIEVGYGFEGILNDAKTGDIGRSMVSGLERKDYSGALQFGLQQVAQIIAADAHVTLDAEIPAPESIVSRLPPSAPSAAGHLVDRSVPYHLVDRWVPYMVAGTFTVVGLIFALLFYLARKLPGGGTGGAASFSSSSDSSSSDDSFGGGDGGSSGGGGSSGSW
jgi:uncharacterized protein